MEIWPYKYRGRSRAEARRTISLSLSRRSTDFHSYSMAPTVFGQLNYSKEHMTPTHKLRKPLVEKLRRDRINTSIEALKSLLGPEFLKQQPDSKQEKADILEMAVNYLRCWQQQKQHQLQQPAATSSPMAACDGYTRCVQEAIGFLSLCEVRSPSHGRLLNHFQNLHASGKSPSSPYNLSPPGSPVHQVSASKGVSQAHGLLWRPW